MSAQILFDKSAHSGGRVEARKIHPNFSILARAPAPPLLIANTAVPRLPAWVGAAGSQAFDAALAEHEAVIVIGADVMDGKYGAALVARIVSYWNHAALRQRAVSILGFSFNKAPRYPAVRARMLLTRILSLYSPAGSQLDG